MTESTGRAADPIAAPPNYLARRAAVVSLLAVLGLGVFYLGTVAFGDDELPAGTRALGVALGGLGREEAVAKLTRATKDRVTAELDVKVGRTHVAVDPRAAGLGLDAAATVEAAVGRNWNPLALFGDQQLDLEPVVRVDRARLDQVVATVAADTDEPVREPAIGFTGLEPELTEEGAAGRALDQPAAADAIVAGYLRTDTIALPVSKVAPSIDDEGEQHGLAAAAAAVAEPVAVRAGTVTATLRPAAIARSLTYAGANGTFTPQLDGTTLRAAIKKQVAAIETPGRDARWRIKGNKPVVVASKVGRGVNAEQLASAVAGVLGRTGAERVVDAPIGTIEPELTTADAKALNITERLSTFTQHYPYAAYRSQNVGQAAKYVDGTVLRPGETFSMNDTIKERTVANGYTTGAVVGPGGVFQDALGGGVSTATSAVWTAAFFAGLERVDTRAHSIWISRYQPGLEATVAWGSFDMKFRNDTSNGVLITTRMTPTSITVSMWGTKVYDEVRAESGPRTNVVPYRTVYNTSAGCRSQSGVSGFSIVVTRVFVKDGEVVRREPMRTQYQPSPQVVCGPDPSKVKPEKPKNDKPKNDKPKPDPSAGPSQSASPDPSD